jgi:predicted permease
MFDRARGLLKQLRALFRKRAVEAEMAEEVAFHLEMEIAENERRGMSAEEARRMALLSYGGTERFTERVREVRWTRWLEDVAADVRYAGRMLSRRPGFALAIVLTLGLGIGGTTAIFTVVDALFLRAPEGVADVATLRKVYIARDDGGVQTGPEGGPGSWVDYVNMRERVRAFAAVGASVGARMVDLGRGAEATQLRADAISNGYLDVLGVQPALGRLIGAEADAPSGAARVAVISHGVWQTHFGGRADVLGETLLLNGERVEIVGVTQHGFGGLDAEPVDVWLPASMAGPMGMMFDAPDYDWRTNVGMAGIDYIARLAPGVDDATATVEAGAVIRQAAEGEPMLDATPNVIMGGLMQADAVGGSEAADLSLWLAIVASLVLIIACANVANLLLARAMTRRRELAVRLAIGAGRWRVARQHLTESLLLALLGGAAGIWIAAAGMRLMQRFPLPPSAGTFDGRLLLFALGVSILTGLLFGTLPALRSTRIDLVTGLRDSRSAGASTRSATRRTLVALQVSLSLALLIGAGLFVRSLRQVNSIDAGADIDRLLMVNTDLRRAGFTTDESEALYERAMQSVAAVPGVESAAMIHFEPLDGAGMSISWSLPGRRQPDWVVEGPYINLAGAGYFETAGTRILRGRGIEPTDTRGEPVAVVNEAMARALDDGGNVVGRCVALGDQVTDGGCTHIVGVVETQLRRYLDPDSRVPVVFMARAQAPNTISWGGPTLLVRTTGAPAERAAAVRAAVQALSSDLPFVRVQPVMENISSQILPHQLGATLFSLFGLLALVLAAVGLYGVLGYFVTERTPEIGIRRSLGAPAGSVVRLVILQGTVPVTVGVVIGLAAAYAGTRFLSSLLFGVDARDPASFAGAAAFMIAVAAVASVIPAWRAARVSPMVALRED